MGKAVVQRDSAGIAMLQSVSELLDAIPDAGGDGSGFVLEILNAGTAADLVGEDSGNDADDLDMMLGHDIRIDNLSKWESDYKGQEGQITDKYLICHGADLTDNRDVVFAVGATTPVVKLAKLWSFGVFPVVGRFTRSDKATAQGYYPMNLAITSISEPVNV